MKVKLKTLMSGPKGSFKPGDIVDETICDVKDLLNCGFAELVEEPEPAKDEAVVDTITIPSADPEAKSETAEQNPVMPKKTVQKGHNKR